jgi:hypothetical protein
MEFKYMFNLFSLPFEYTRKKVTRAVTFGCKEKVIKEKIERERERKIREMLF